MRSVRNWARKPRSWWGTRPRTLDAASVLVATSALALALAGEVWGGGGGACTLRARVETHQKKKKEKRETYPSGCCKSDTRSSTAVDAAIEASPGRVTVHIWSSVRSVKDYVAHTA